MHYVYILKSKQSSGTYVGLTNNLEKRLMEHNRGEVKATASGRPFDLMSYVAFIDRKRACDFERYLKTASGRAFINKRLFV